MEPVTNRIPGKLIASPVSFLYTWSNRNYSHMRVHSSNKHQVFNRFDYDSTQQDGLWLQCSLGLSSAQNKHRAPGKEERVAQEGPDSAKGLRVFYLPCSLYCCVNSVSSVLLCSMD